MIQYAFNSAVTQIWCWSWGVVCCGYFFHGICMGRSGLLFPDVGIPDFRPSFCLCARARGQHRPLWCWCHGWKLWGLIVLRSSPHLWLPFLGRALPAREFTQLHYTWNSPWGKKVGDCPRNTFPPPKKRGETESLGGVTSLSCPYQDSHLVQRDMQDTIPVYH